MLVESLEKVDCCACTLHDGKGQEQQEFVRPQGQSQGLAGHGHIQDASKVIYYVKAKIWAITLTTLATWNKQGRVV